MSPLLLSSSKELTKDVEREYARLFPVEGLAE